MATQAERTAVTRTKLLDAAASCLAELGYRRTSTTEICRRAGVSRGAQLHHFPTKADLVSAALDHVFERRVDEFRALVQTLPTGLERIDGAIDVLWSVFQGETFAAWFELATAARTEPELQDRMSVASRVMGERIREVWIELFPPPPGYHATPVFFETAPMFLFTILDGLAMRRLTHTESVPGEADIVLGAVKFLAAENPLYEKDDTP
jgi:AcrR family transcriptional regulator